MEPAGAACAFNLLDLPAMAKPGQGGGLGGAYVGRLREMEALIVVLRAFDDPAIPADESGTDPVAQAEELTLELAVADHEVFARRAPKIAKEATADPSKRAAAEQPGWSKLSRRSSRRATRSSRCR